MPRKINEAKFGITDTRYKELRYFCYQYPEWKRFLSAHRDTFRGRPVDGLPHATGSHSDPTGDLAVKRSQYERFCRIVEESARECNDVLSPYLLKYVTDNNITFHYLETVMRIPCGKTYFHRSIQRFYFLLDKKRDF